MGKLLPMTENPLLKDRLATEGAAVGFGAATLTRQGDRVVFTGAPTGQHSLYYDACTDERLNAHAKGYAAVAGEAKANG
jgi:hypothetical protein